MKTNKLPQSDHADLPAAGSQSKSASYEVSADYSPLTGRTSFASNDADYYFMASDTITPNFMTYAFKAADSNLQPSTGSAQPASNAHCNGPSHAMTKSGCKDDRKNNCENDYKKASLSANHKTTDSDLEAYYQQLKAELSVAPLSIDSDNDHDGKRDDKARADKELNTKPTADAPIKNMSIDKGETAHVSDTAHQTLYQAVTHKPLTQAAPTTHDMTQNNIPERVFMNSLIKHTGIALAIIIPLAAFTAYAAPQAMPINQSKTAAVNTKKATTKAVQPSDIIYKSASTPTTVDSVDLSKYAGTWYEIGRLPMYFQRNCARDVTATYTPKTDSSGITVLNQCTGEDGTAISAEGLAKPADNTGSKLKVTFLPSWIRWLPVGRADYWVLARDGDYQTALVGTPDKDYLWLLARTPNISQQTYAKYRQIAQEQGYDLKEFQLTAQSQQTVNLVP